MTAGLPPIAVRFPVVLAPPVRKAARSFLGRQMRHSSYKPCRACPVRARLFSGTCSSSVHYPFCSRMRVARSIQTISRTLVGNYLQSFH